MGSRPRSEPEVAQSGVVVGTPSLWPGEEAVAVGDGQIVDPAWRRRIRPYLRPVRTAIREALDRSVLRPWTDGTPPYRPRNPYLEPWIREEL
jgi:hypothetical protein